MHDDIDIVVIAPSPLKYSSDDLSSEDLYSFSDSTPPSTSSNNPVCAIVPLVEESWDLAATGLVTPVASCTSTATNSPLVRELVELSNAPYESSPSRNSLYRTDGDMKLEGSFNSRFLLDFLFDSCVLNAAGITTLSEADAAQAVAVRLVNLVDALHAALARTQSLLEPPSEAISHLRTLRSALGKALMSELAAQTGIPERLCHAIFSLLQTLGASVEFKDVQPQLSCANAIGRVSHSFVEAVFTRVANPQLMPTPPAPNDTLHTNLLLLLNLTSSFTQSGAQLAASGSPTAGWKLLFESLQLLEELCKRPESAFVAAERWRAPQSLLELLSELMRIGALIETSGSRESLYLAARNVECSIIAILRALRTFCCSFCFVFFVLSQIIIFTKVVCSDYRLSVASQLSNIM